MNLSRLIATSLLAASFASHAATENRSGVLPLDAFQGYGYSYSATWDSTILFDFSVQVDSRTYINGAMEHSFGNLILMLRPLVADPNSLTSLDVEGSFSAKLINLSTGAVELPEALRNPVTGAVPYTSMGTALVFGGACATPGAAVELRFSNHSCDIFTSETPIADPAGSAIRAGVISEINLHSRAGNFLIASDDPSCASLDCMPRRHDILAMPNITLVALASVGPVPEPASYALFGVGLAGLVAYARRRKA